MGWQGEGQVGEVAGFETEGLIVMDYSSKAIHSMTTLNLRPQSFHFPIETVDLDHLRAVDHPRIAKTPSSSKPAPCGRVDLEHLHYQIQRGGIQEGRKESANTKPRLSLVGFTIIIVALYCGKWHFLLCSGLKHKHGRLDPCTVKRKRDDQGRRKGR